MRLVGMGRKPSARYGLLVLVVCSNTQFFQDRSLKKLLSLLNCLCTFIRYHWTIHLLTLQASGWLTLKQLLHSPCGTLEILFYLFYFLLIDFRRGVREDGEKHRLVVSLIYAFIGWFLYVPWLRWNPYPWCIRTRTPTASWVGVRNILSPWVFRLNRVEKEWQSPLSKGTSDEAGSQKNTSGVGYSSHWETWQRHVPSDRSLTVMVSSRYQKCYY